MNSTLENQRQLTEEERQMLISVFHSVDNLNSGYLKREDLKVAMVLMLGYKPSKYELNHIMQALRSQEDREYEGITQEEFLTLMAPKVRSIDEDDEIRQIFLTFDSQCRGFISLDDVQKAFAQVAPHLPAHSYETAFREIDRDGDGRVSFKDFEFMMKYSRENGF